MSSHFVCWLIECVSVQRSEVSTECLPLLLLSYLSLDLVLTDWLDWLANELQRSAGLLFPSVGVMGAHHYAHLSVSSGGLRPRS